MRERVEMAVSEMDDKKFQVPACFSFLLLFSASVGKYNPAKSLHICSTPFCLCNCLSAAHYQMLEDEKKITIRVSNL